MTEVIKKNSTREPFDTNKIRESIRKASKEAPVELERANELIRWVSKHGSKGAEGSGDITSRDIRERILVSRWIASPNEAFFSKRSPVPGDCPFCMP